MIKKSIAFSVIALLVAAPFVVRLPRVQREDRDALTLQRALDDGRRNGDTAPLADALRHGAPANTRIYSYVTGNDSAIRQGQLARCLVPNDDSWSPLWAAAEAHDLPAVELLLHYGGDPRFGQTSDATIGWLYGAAEGSEYDMRYKTVIPIIRLLVAHGADVNQGVGVGEGSFDTALDYAVLYRDTQSVVALCKMGARPTSFTYFEMDDGWWDGSPRCRETLHALVRGAGGKPPACMPGTTETYVHHALHTWGSPGLAHALEKEGFAP